MQPQNAEEPIAIDPQLALLSDILDWSKDRPLWIRDALRTLVTKPEGVTVEDVHRFVNICKKESGIPCHPVEPLVFDQPHITVQQKSSEKISLLGISEIVGVNALAQGAKLDFESTGINLVYGDNGSGKTSYTRILKKNCRCAASSSIQSNVYEPPANKQAKISYAVGNDQSDFLWTEEAECPPYLNAIRIFDSRCADVYVNKEREASFTPYGLNIFSNLADNICSQVKATLVQEKDTLKKHLPDITSILEDQKARTWITSLTAYTPEEEIDLWTKFSLEDETELKQLKSVLSVPDPQQRIVALQAQTTRIEQVVKMLSNIETYFSAQGISTLKKLVNDQAVKRHAADAAVNSAFNNTPLHGTGTESWKILWESARSFVQSIAYPKAEFPNTERCPLCQQKLGDEALTLMNRFETYVKGEVEAQAQAAKVALNNYWIQLQQVTLDLTPHAPLLKELEPVTSKNVTNFFQSALAIKNRLTNVIEQNSWEKLPTLQVSPHQMLLNLISSINTEIAALKQSVNPTQRLSQQDRHNHLISRKTFHSHKNAISTEVQRLSLIAYYEKAIASCNPLSISRKSGSLAEKYVTPELQSVFENRLKQLFGDRCFVELEKTRTNVGVTYFRLKLANVTANIPIVDVVSEGEFRAIALAAFLAEIDLANDLCGIVFDDPVSSLDHRFRERFAEIVREVARERQVIVFTHDIFFLSCITYWGNRANPKQAPTCIELLSIGGRHGYSQNGVPMEVKTFKARRKHILKEIKDAKAYLKGNDIKGCMRIANSLTPEMRKVTEKAVEEVLFNGAVVRYDPAIHTQKLHPMLTTIIEDDIKFIVSLMDRYSLFPHDQAPERKPAQPDIGVIEHDIESLQTWVTNYRKRT